MPKIRVRELANRLSIMNHIHVSIEEVVALGKKVGLPPNPVTSGLDENQLRRLFADVWGAEVNEKIGQLMTPARPIEVPAAPPSVRPSPAARRPFPPRSISESARTAAAAAAAAVRPAPAPPKMAPAARPASGGTVRVTSMSAMARAILPQALRESERIARHKAKTWEAKALEWANAGFDDRTVRPWILRDLSPTEASYLASRHVDPAVLDLDLRVSSFVVSDRVAPGQTLLDRRLVPVESVYAMVVAAGYHVPTDPPEPVLVVGPQIRTQVTARPAPQVTFSNPGDPDQPVVPPSRHRGTARSIGRRDDKGNHRRGRPSV